MRIYFKIQRQFHTLHVITKHDNLDTFHLRYLFHSVFFFLIFMPYPYTELVHIRNSLQTWAHAHKRTYYLILPWNILIVNIYISIQTCIYIYAFRRLNVMETHIQKSDLTYFKLFVCYYRSFWIRCMNTRVDISALLNNVYLLIQPILQFTLHPKYLLASNILVRYLCILAPYRFPLILKIIIDNKEN